MPRKLPVTTVKGSYRNQRYATIKYSSKRKKTDRKKQLEESKRPTASPETNVAVLGTALEPGPLPVSEPAPGAELQLPSLSELQAAVVDGSSEEEEPESPSLLQGLRSTGDAIEHLQGLMAKERRLGPLELCERLLRAECERVSAQRQRTQQRTERLEGKRRHVETLHAGLRAHLADLDVECRNVLEQRQKMEAQLKVVALLQAAQDSELRALQEVGGVPGTDGNSFSFPLDEEEEEDRKPSPEELQAALAASAGSDPLAADVDEKSHLYQLVLEQAGICKQEPEGPDQPPAPGVENQSPARKKQ